MDQALKEARSALAAEWASRQPSTPAEIHEFYRDAHGIREDLRAWHDTTERKRMTNAVLQVAAQIGAKTAVDIGCGAGNDLFALQKSGVPDVAGVEPNTELRRSVERLGIRVHDDIAAAPIEEADLLVCVDVFEHVPDAESFLAEIARRARVGGAKPGAVLVESHSGYDTGTPLHLAENRAWHPGHVLEAHGFQLLTTAGPLRIWQRANKARVGAGSAILLCAYRALTMPTFHSVQNLVNKRDGWRIITKTGDALISRARSIVASRWLLETADDVFLMVDDDITFLPEVAEKIVALARERDIACAAYPVRSGEHLAARTLDPSVPVEFDPSFEPQEIEYAGTGFMAVHRRVLEGLAKTLTFCHENEPWAFWPFFMPMIAERGGASLYLSEDWAFCERARAAGFHVWMDRSVRIGHLAVLELNVGNMHEVDRAVKGGFEH